MSNSDYEHIERLGGSRLIRDYLSGAEKLENFIADFPSKEALLSAAKAKSISEENRAKLFDAVRIQYANTGVSSPSFWEEVLKPNTYTVTTGHQLNLFGGPKYFIYKIISVIKLAKELNDYQDKYKFLPVFWMATEDHDFEEINYVNVFNRSLKSNLHQSGPVGRINPSLFDEAFEELKGVLGTSEEASDLIQRFSKAFDQNSLADFTRYWVNELFENKVVIVDGDDAVLKELFVPVIQKELKEQVTDKFVSQTNEKLERLGYHTQVSHRAINLFYIEEGIRERIGYLNGQHKIHNLSRCLKPNDVLVNPKCISPNALLRPVYQELILPNVAYIGGPGELAYWFQLKELFDQLGVLFPILMLRDSFLFVSKSDIEHLNGMNISLEDLQLEENELKRLYIERNNLKQIDFEMDQNQLEEVFKGIDQKIEGMNRDYHQMIAAEKQRMRKFIDKLELRAYRDAKFREEVNLKRLIDIRKKYFPDGGLVERTTSFMEEFILLGKQNYFERLEEVSDPFDHRIKVITVNK